MADWSLIAIALPVGGAVFAAAAFVIRAAFQVGRASIAIEAMKKNDERQDAAIAQHSSSLVWHQQKLESLNQRVDSLDAKTERHLQWHEDLQRMPTLPGE